MSEEHLTPKSTNMKLQHFGFQNAPGHSYAPNVSGSLMHPIDKSTIVAFQFPEGFQATQTCSICEMDPNISEVHRFEHVGSLCVFLCVWWCLLVYAIDWKQKHPTSTSQPHALCTFIRTHSLPNSITWCDGPQVLNSYMFAHGNNMQTHGYTSCA